MRVNCKIANTEEGMEMLTERTLQRQIIEQQVQLEALASRLAALELTDDRVAQPSTLPVNNITNNQINIAVIMPWDGERRISVEMSHIIAAFAENSRLKEFVRMEERDQICASIAPPYITELFVDLVRRAHADPASRNVYLNPRRADQALVQLKNGEWDVVLLEEATRLMFDGVARRIQGVVMSTAERTQLPSEAQNALGLAGLMYDDEPDEYARRAKGPMAAHLQNTAPYPRVSSTGPTPAVTSSRK